MEDTEAPPEGAEAEEAAGAEAEAEGAGAEEAEVAEAEDADVAEADADVAGAEEAEVEPAAEPEVGAEPAAEEVAAAADAAAEDVGADEGEAVGQAEASEVEDAVGAGSESHPPTEAPASQQAADLGVDVVPGADVPDGDRTAALKDKERPHGATRKASEPAPEDEPEPRDADQKAPEPEPEPELEPEPEPRQSDTAPETGCAQCKKMHTESTPLRGHSDPADGMWYCDDCWKTYEAPAPQLLPQPPKGRKRKGGRRKQRGAAKTYNEPPPSEDRLAELTGFRPQMCSGRRGLRKQNGLLATSAEVSRSAGVTPLLSNREKPPPELGALQENQPQSVSEWLAQWVGSEQVMPDGAGEEPAGVGGAAAALKTLHESPFNMLQSRSSRNTLGHAISQAMGPAAVRMAARQSMSARDRPDRLRPRQIDREGDTTSTLSSLKEQMKANLNGLDDAINVVDKNGRFRFRQERRKRAMRAMEKEFQQQMKKGVKLKLSKEEMIARETNQISKIIKDAIRSQRSLNGQTLGDIRSVFEAIDKDGSGELDHDEFATAMNRLGLGLTSAQVDQLVKVLDVDGDGSVSLDEFMVLIEDDAAGKAAQDAAQFAAEHPQVAEQRRKQEEAARAEIYGTGSANDLDAEPEPAIDGDGPAPEPGSTAKPEVESAPESAAEAALEPEAEPEQIAMEPEMEPEMEPDPESVGESELEPAAELAAEPAVEHPAESEPAEEPAAEPAAAEPAVEPAAAEPTVEPAAAEPAVEPTAELAAAEPTTAPETEAEAEAEPEAE